MNIATGEAGTLNVSLSESGASKDSITRARGTATQGRILEKAVQIASVEGLSAMSLATLAKATNMSKSGLFAHFKSKEALQLAIIDEAERIFDAAVKHAARHAAAGRPRLEAMLYGYADYASSATFEGGCFFAATAHEYDGRPGPIRERLQLFFQRWDSAVTEAIVDARRLGQIRSDVDIDQVLFELSGIGLAANLGRQFQSDPLRARDRSRAAVRAIVQRLSLPA